MDTTRMKRSTIAICGLLLIGCVLLFLLRGRLDKRTAHNADGARQNESSGLPPANFHSPPPAAEGLSHIPLNRFSSGQKPLSGLNDSNAALQQILNAWHVPIDFYGKVVDEHNNAVSGAAVTFSWTANPLDELARTSSTLSDSNGCFALHGAQGPSLDVIVSKQGYYSSKQDQWGFAYGITGHFSPDPANPVVFHLRKKGNPEHLIAVGGIGLSTMRDYWVARDGSPTEISLRDGRQVSIGQGDLRVEVWIGKPLEDFPSRSQWKCRISVPGGGLIPVEDEFAFQAPIEGYQPSDEWVSAGTSWSEKVEKKYFVMLRDGNFGLVTLRVIGVPNPFFRLTSLVNPSGSHNLEPAN